MKKIINFALFLSIITYTTVLIGQTTQQTGPWEDNNTWIEDAPGYTFGNNVIITISVTHQVETLEGIVFSFMNNATLNIYGDLIINGSVEVNNNLVLNVDAGGSLVINGNLNMHNNGALVVNGTLTADTISGDNGNSVTGDGDIYVDYIDGVDTENFDGVINTDPMPVELLYFNLSQVSNAVIIEWATASEINNDFFTIERSIDGINWDVIKTIQGYGNSNHYISYETKDEYPIDGVSYYRLKQTDFDGKLEYFDPLPFEFVNSEKESQIIALSASKSIVQVWLTNYDKDSRLIFADLNGNLISLQNIQVNNHIQQISVSLPREYSGEILIIRMESSNNSDFKKVLVN